MTPKPLTDAQKAAYQQHVKDKTWALRVRLFADWCVKMLLGLGILALLGFGVFYAWTLVQAKDGANRIEQRMQDKIEEAERDAYPD